jgi:hypothetical protein
MPKDTDFPTIASTTVSPAPSTTELKAEGKPIISSAIVFELKTKNRNRRRFSSGTKDTQRLSLGLSKSAYRVANSFAEGFWTFSDRSEQSSRRRRDGVVRDSLRNASKGVEKGFNELGRAPGEIARRISGRNVWRTFRLFTP